MTKVTQIGALPRGVKVSVMQQNQIDEIVPLWQELDKHVYQQLSDYSRLKKSSNYPSYIKKWLKQNYDDENAIVMIALAEQKVVGFVTAQIQNLPWYAIKVQGFIGPLYVQAHYRRKGIGSCLIQALENWFSEQAVEYVDVIWDQGNTNAQGFWSGLGFHPIQVRASKILKSN